MLLQTNGLFIPLLAILSVPRSRAGPCPRTLVFSYAVALIASLAAPHAWRPSSTIPGTLPLLLTPALRDLLAQRLYQMASGSADAQ